MSSPRIVWPHVAGLGSISGEDGEAVFIIESEGSRVNARGRIEYFASNLQLRYEWLGYEDRLHYAYGPANPEECVTATMLAVGKEPEEAARLLADLIDSGAVTEIGTLNRRSLRFFVDLSELGAKRLYRFDDFVRAYLFTSEPKDAPRTRPQRLYMIAPKRGNAAAPSARINGKTFFYPFVFPVDLAMEMDHATAEAEGRIIDAGILKVDGSYFINEETRKRFARLAVTAREGTAEGYDDILDLLVKVPEPFAAALIEEEVQEVTPKGGKAKRAEVTA